MYLSPEVYGPQPLPPVLMRDVYQIYRNSRHLLDMIDDILDLSRFEMVGFTLKKEPTDLAHLIEEAAAIVGNLFEKSAEVALVVDVAPVCPSSTSTRRAFARCCSTCSTTPTVSLPAAPSPSTAAQVDNDILVQVHDTGPGISAEDAAAIFTEFYQVDYSLSRSHGGAGLGLAICQRFVEAHNGRIWVDSEADSGSTFSFTLPIDLSKVDHTNLYRSPAPDPQTKEIKPCLLLVGVRSTGEQFGGAAFGWV
ncbi:MAG: HAMP domain-containing histidine kinase [Chloroflexi bacterium]|nr:HAMP domain-containing histidine kinase [Chloroflexota bacterium]